MTSDRSVISIQFVSENANRMRILTASSLFYAHMLPPFVERILSIGARPFAVVETRSVCAPNLERCILSEEWPHSFNDVFSRLMHQRWLVMRALLLEETTPVVYAGMDVLLFSSKWSIPTPMAFEMRVHGDHIVHFTPDLAFATPHEESFRFLDAVNATLNRSKPLVTSIPPRIMREIAYYDTYLMGPAQQDGLMDVLYQRLTGYEQSPRREWLASKAASSRQGRARVPPNPEFRVRLNPSRLNISAIPQKYFVHCLGKRSACLSTPVNGGSV